MKILVSGSTGFLGSELVYDLQIQGHQVVRLVRHKDKPDDTRIPWDIHQQKLNPDDLKGIDAVIHLAGENIAGGRWTEERKKRILESRVQGTRLLAETLAKMGHPPHTLICASAVGYYGSRGDEVLTEVSAPGHGFLSEVCKQWEAAAKPAVDKSIRVAHTRFAMILDPSGGALQKMVWPFKLGLAGNLGNGKQMMSWVSREDVVGAIEHVLEHPELRGPINVVAPNPVSNAEFTKTLKSVLIPPFVPMRHWSPPAPAFAIKALLGEMGEELFLASQRVRPVRLLETGYKFKHPRLHEALKAMF